MMTVKHIHLCGLENIWPAKFVEFVPISAQSETTVVGPNRDFVRVITDTGEERELSEGTIFVMNANGRTVSRYDLSATEVAFGDDPLLTAHKTRDRAREGRPHPRPVALS